MDAFDSPLPDLPVAIITVVPALRPTGWLVLPRACRSQASGQVESIVTLYVAPEGLDAARAKYPTATLADLSAANLHLALLAEQKSVVSLGSPRPSVN